MIIRTPADIGALIRERRAALGLDQQTLAKQVGTSRKWVIEVEAGKPGVGLGLVLRTLRVLGIELKTTVAPSRPAQRGDLQDDDLDAFLDSLKKTK